MKNKIAGKNWEAMYIKFWEWKETKAEYVELATLNSCQSTDIFLGFYRTVGYWAIVADYLWFNFVPLKF